MWKLTRLSSLQETKSLASHPLRKIPQSLVGYKEKERENKYIYEKQSKCSVFYFLAKLYKGCVSGNKLPRFYIFYIPLLKKITNYL